MAFQMNFVAPAGTNVASLMEESSTVYAIKDEDTLVKNGYLRISRLEGNKGAVIFFLDYKRSEGSEVIFSESFTFQPPDDPNSIRWDKAAYLYLKTLSQFKEAVDLLEDEIV